MSKSKAKPESFKVNSDGVELFYTLVHSDGQRQAKFVYKDTIFRTPWRASHGSIVAITNDVIREVRKQLELERLHAVELEKLKRWNAGIPIFGWGGAQSSGPLIDNGSDGAGSAGAH